MSESLFREEAISAMSARHMEPRRLQLPSSMVAGTMMLFLVIVLISMLIGSFTYARKHMVTGQLDETNTIILHATDFGFVKSLLVAEGESVRRGQMLAEIYHRDDERNSKGAAELRSRIAKLEQAIAEAETTAKLQSTALSDEERRIGTRLSITRKSLDIQNSKIDALQQQLDRTSELHQQGYLSNLDWLGFRTGLANEKQQRYALHAQLVELEQQHKAIGHRRHSVRAEKQKTLLQLGLNLSQASENLTRTLHKPYEILTATHDGFISRIETVEGGSVTPGQPVMYINDDGQASTATLLVPPTATGHIQPGDQLSLELDAFPLETFGHISGEVISIPRHTVMAGRTPVYPIRLHITPSPSIPVYLPGMTLTGFITVERKTLRQWLLGPLQRKLESLG